MAIPYLSTLIFAPIGLGALLLFFGNRHLTLSKLTAFSVSFFCLILSLQMLWFFDSSLASMQFVEQKPWVQIFHLQYYLGVDGISLPLVVLSNFISVIVIIAAFQSIHKRVVQYLGIILVMAGLMNGVFSALDSILFYLFFEAILIPMFLLIGIWGGPARVYASLKFFLYTFLGSVMFLVALFYLKSQSGSFAIEDFHYQPLNIKEQKLIFLAFALAFAVKIPMVPVHTWLPDAHVEAPTGGSVILAAILLKLGAYGFMRFSLPITPDASAYFALPMIVLSLVAIGYISFVALAQSDMKKLIAYSSIAHMGFVTLGLFLIYALIYQGQSHHTATMAMSGAMVQVLSHGLISAAMFLCIGVLYDRTHSREIKTYGGVVVTMPVFASLMVFFSMANAGLPGTSGFIGEFLVIIAAFQAQPWFAFLAALTLVIGAGYSLWLIKRVIFGKPSEAVLELKDLDGIEMLTLFSLALLVLILGLYPQPLIELMASSLDLLVNQATTTKL